MANVKRAVELFLLTATVAMEAEGESYEGKLAVAYVIMNRITNRGGTISETVLKSHAFSAWNTKSGRRVRLDSISASAWEDSERAAISAYYFFEKDPTVGADHYLNIKLTRKLRRKGDLPSWVSKLTKTVKIGLHTFYKEAK